MTTLVAITEIPRGAGVGSCSASVNLVNASGSGRALLILAVCGDAQATSADLLTSATFNSVALSAVDESHIGGGPRGGIKAFLMLDSVLPEAAGSYTAVVNSSDASTDMIYAVAIEFSGAPQTGTIAGIAKPPLNGGSTTLSLTPSPAGQLQVGIAFRFNLTSTDVTLTPTVGNEIADDEDTGGASRSSISVSETTGGTLTWTLSATDAIYGAMAVALTGSSAATIPLIMNHLRQQNAA